MTNKHGGKRKGAGIKAKDGTVECKPSTVTLDPKTVSKAKRIGEGNLSLGLREAVRKYPE